MISSDAGERIQHRSCRILVNDTKANQPRRSFLRNCVLDNLDFETMREATRACANELEFVR